MIRRQRHAGALGTGIIITEFRVRVRRHDGELRTAADVVQQAVEQERTVRTGGDGLDRRAVRALQHNIHIRQSAVVRHEDRTTYLTVGRTPAFSRGAVGR